MSYETIWLCMALRPGELERPLKRHWKRTERKSLRMFEAFFCRNYFYPLHLEPANFYGDEVGVYDIVLPHSELLAQAGLS